MMYNFNASPICLYDMPMKVVESGCSPVRYAIDQHRNGHRPPVAIPPTDQ